MPQITAVRAVVAILATYGRHLAQTLEQRAVRRGFATIARFFGCVVLDTIAAHVHRGVMRAMALDDMLKKRAERGRDLKYLAPRARREPPAKDPETEAAAKPAPLEEFTPEWMEARHAAGPRAGEQLVRRIARGVPLTMATLPRSSVVAAEVWRWSVGRTIAAICRDLGVSASLCEATFWNSVFDSIRWYRGNPSTLILDLKRREQKFNKEEWKHPGLELAEERREGIRRVLGFFIGEDPPDDAPGDPFEVVAGPGAGVAAVATGPP